MALIENGSRGFVVGMLTGIGIAVAGRALFGPLRPIGRPLAKVTLKTGLAAMERTREKLAEYGETLEDLLAEVRVEMAAGQSASPPGQGTAERAKKGDA
jgi:hypothetical protein